MSGFIALLFAANVAMAGLIQPGDANGDGKVDWKDFDLLYRVLYRNYQAPLENVPMMDVDGDGKVDVRDMVALSQALSSKTPLPQREAPKSSPTVVPRFTDYLWGVPAKKKLLRDIQHKMFEIDKGIWSYEASTYPNEDLVAAFESLKSEVEYALHYKMIPYESLLCGQVLWLGDRVAQKTKARDHWLAERPEGRNYLDKCAKDPNAINRHVMGASVDWRCSELFGIIPQEGDLFGYYIERSGGKLRLKIPYSIKFDSGMSPAHQMKFAGLWSKAMSCAKAYWSRYGVEFEPYLHEGADASITIYADNRRSNSVELSMGNLEFDACSLLLHESGHWLGLNDEYDEKGWDCKGRGNAPDGMMSYPFSVATKRFYPVELQRIFGKVCGAYSP